MSCYSVDTSSLLQAWTVRYPADVFPGVWAALDHLIAMRQLVASEMVLEELKRKSDEVSAWSLVRREMFVDMDEAQSTEAQKIVRQYRRLIDERKGRNQADPFVIALAKLRGMVCVTEEDFGSATKVRIPYVCEELSVEYTNLVGLLRREGYRLSLDIGGAQGDSKERGSAEETEAS
jgi:hypothetical protein